MKKLNEYKKDAFKNEISNEDIDEIEEYYEEPKVEQKKEEYYEEPKKVEYYGEQEKEEYYEEPKKK